MVIIGFMMHHMLRVNMSIAIVEIMSKNSTSLKKNQLHFNWNEEQRNNILGFFFWGYLTSQIPGGRLAEICGTKIVLGSSMLAAGILTILVPFCGTYSYMGILINRICLGIVMGVQWPALYPMASRWIALSDRSKFMSHLIASSLGAGLTLLFSGYLMNYFGWSSIFYTTGVLATIWSVVWFFLIYDSPTQHPRISATEKNKLLLEVGDQNVKLAPKVTPWIKILTSVPVWAVSVANLCATFTFFVILNQLPSYFHQVLQFNIKDNGILSALPFFGNFSFSYSLYNSVLLARYAAAVLACRIADNLIKKRKFSIVTIRQFFTTISFAGPVLLYGILSFWGNYRTISVIFFTLSFAFNGFGTAGFITNALDIAPNYSGTIFGIGNCIASLSGYVSTKWVAMITQDDQSFNQWKYVFWTLVSVNILGMVFYWFTASGKQQQWSIANTTKVKDAKIENTLLMN